MPKADRDAIVEAVREQYETFPYPPFESIVQEDINRDLRESFNTEFKFEKNRSLKPGAKMWVPGCGTRWAVMLALQFKDVEVLATDLSDNNLAKQEELARLLGLTQIEFRREDILNARYKEEFDFISCVGVLHHLPDPDEGFQVLSRALKTTGLAEIMVYDQMNRRYSMRIRQIIETFDPHMELSAEGRFDFALKVLKSLNKHASAPRELSRILRYLDGDPAFRSELADFISHPQEHYFDVPSLLRSLQSAGLKPHTWRPPYRFNPKFMLTNNDLWDEIDGMTAERCAHLAHLLGAALLEVFVEPVKAITSPLQPDVPNRRVRLIDEGVKHRMCNGATPPRTERHTKLLRNEGGLWFDGGERRPAVAAYGIDVDCVKRGQRRLLKISDLGFKTSLLDEHIEAIIKHAKTPTTISEIAAGVSEDKSLTPVSHSELERMCDQLCRTPFRILATV